MGTLKNDGVPDEMQHRAFHQGLHCFKKPRRIYFFEIMSCEPSMYTMDHPDSTE